ncbi:MAG: putative Ig domain-containing protein [Solirubrobacterales bacterium]|nr:putative Ig domain-containing protein [Solirubrobacterales bacterium]
MSALRKMVPVAFACLLALCTSAAAALAPSSPGSGQIRIGRAPPRPAGSTILGALPSATKLPLSVELKPRDPAALAAYAAAVSTPGSPEYRHYLSVAQFAQRFGPAPAQIAAVEASLRARGLQPGPVSANRLAIPLTAAAGTIEHSFSTPLERVALPRGRTAFANTEAPLIDQRVAGVVQAVIGLDSLTSPQPLSIQSSPAASEPHISQPHVVTGGPQPCQKATTTAQTDAAYTADQIASAYGFSGLYGAGDDGAGQTIAVYELESNTRSDIAAYQQCYGTSASVSYVEVDGGPGSASGSDSGLETDLDVETVIGLAPKANVIVYQGPPASANAKGPLDTYSQIVNDDKANIVATSWGSCEQDLQPNVAQQENTLFEEAAAQGQTILAAAGDDGSEDCYPKDVGASATLAVDDPASQPSVTSVGGTTLSLSPSRSETVWNDADGAGGGGVSTLWPMPSYQAGAPASLHVTGSSSTACGASSGQCREVPDVSSDADPLTGVLVLYNGQWMSVGGTSGAAPTWAAVFGLANASSGCAGTPIGFANPELYKIAASRYAANFNDVTMGTNDYTGSTGQYSAGTGYDMASGLGSPNATSLTAALCASQASPPPPPPTVSNPGSQSSLIDTPQSLQIQASGNQLSYTASGLPPGLSINSASGVISGTVTSTGSYPVTVTAVDANGSIGRAQFTWSVSPAAVTIANPGNEATRVGQPALLQLRAQANNGGAISYSAIGLPLGLTIASSSGLISGTPSAAGTSTVTVIAATAGGPPASIQFSWTISANPVVTPKPPVATKPPVRGKPVLSKASLSGIAKGNPSLAFTLTAGRGALALRKLSIAIPGQLALTGQRRGLWVLGAGGRRLLFTKTEPRAVLVIALRSAASSFRVTVSSPAIRAGTALTSAVKRKRHTPITPIVTVTDASGVATRLPLTVKPF